MALNFEGAEMQLHLSMTLGVCILLGLPGRTAHRECMDDPVYIRISKMFHRVTFTEFG